MAVDSSGLVRAAMMLRGEAPAAWTGFVGAFQEYAAAMNGEMLKCAPELLQRGQGMALMAHELAAVIADAPQLYDKMTRPQGRPDGRRTERSTFT
jgi:hypothetical protein